MKYIVIYLLIYSWWHLNEAKHSHVKRHKYVKKNISTSQERKKEDTSDHSILMEELLKYLQPKQKHLKKTKNKKLFKNKNNDIVSTNLQNIPENPFFINTLNIPEVPIYSHVKSANSFKRHDLKYPEPKKVKHSLKTASFEKTGHESDEPQFIKEKTFTLLAQDSKGENYVVDMNSNVTNNKSGLINLSGWDSTKREKSAVHLLRLHRIDFPKLIKEILKNKRKTDKHKTNVASNREINKHRRQPERILIDGPERYTEFLAKDLVEDLQPEFNRIGDSEFKIGKSEDTDRRFIKLEKDGDNLIQLSDVKKGFFKQNTKVKNNTEVLRKDYIPHPNYNNKRNFLPFSISNPNYGSLQQPFTVPHLQEFPAQYPEMLNLRPMNDLYSRSQLLDANEKNIVNKYLKSEKIEEDTLKNSNPDTMLLTDNSGNVYQGTQTTKETSNVNELSMQDDAEKAKLKEKRKTLLALLRSAIQKKKEENLKQIQSKLLTLKRLEDSRQKSVYVSTTTPNVNKNITVTSLMHRNIYFNNNKKKNNSTASKSLRGPTNYLLVPVRIHHVGAVKQKHIKESFNQPSIFEDAINEKSNNLNVHHTLGTIGSTNTSADYSGVTTAQNKSDFETLDDYFDLKPAHPSGVKLIDSTHDSNDRGDHHHLQAHQTSETKSARTSDTTGQTRQMNEFKFNGQINLSPGADPNNIRIVHGPPPADLMDVFATAFPQPAKITPFAAFAGLNVPPGHPTMQPTATAPSFRNGYPWAWHKNQNSPTKSRNLPPHTHTPTRKLTTKQNVKQKQPTTQVVTTPKPLKPTNTQPAKVIQQHPIVSKPLDESSESKILKEIGNSESTYAADGEAVLDNDANTMANTMPTLKEDKLNKTINKENNGLNVTTTNQTNTGKEKSSSSNLPVAYVTYEKNAMFTPEEEKAIAQHREKFQKQQESEVKQHIHLNQHTNSINNELKTLNIKHLFGSNEFMEKFGKTKNDKLTLLNKNMVHHTPLPNIEDTVHLYTPLSENKVVVPAVNKPFYDFLTSLPTAKVIDTDKRTFSANDDSKFATNLNGTQQDNKNFRGNDYSNNKRMGSEESLGAHEHSRYKTVENRIRKFTKNERSEYNTGDDDSQSLIKASNDGTTFSGTHSDNKRFSNTENDKSSTANDEKRTANVYNGIENELREYKTKGNDSQSLSKTSNAGTSFSGTHSDNKRFSNTENDESSTANDEKRTANVYNGMENELSEYKTKYNDSQSLSKTSNDRSSFSGTHNENKRFSNTENDKSSTTNDDKSTANIYNSSLKDNSSSTTEENKFRSSASRDKNRISSFEHFNNRLHHANNEATGDVLFKSGLDEYNLPMMNTDYNLNKVHINKSLSRMKSSGDRINHNNKDDMLSDQTDRLEIKKDYSDVNSSIYGYKFNVPLSRKRYNDSPTFSKQFKNSKRKRKHHIMSSNIKPTKVFESTGDKRTFQSFVKYDNGEALNVISEEQVNDENENVERKNITPKRLAEGLNEMEQKLRHALNSEKPNKYTPTKRLVLRNLTNNPITKLTDTSSLLQHEIATIDLSKDTILKNIEIATTAKLKNFTTNSYFDDINEDTKSHPTVLPFVDADKSSKLIEDEERTPVKLITDEGKKPLKLRLLHDDEIIDLVTQSKIKSAVNEDVFNTENENSNNVDAEKEEQTLKERTEEKLSKFHADSDDFSPYKRENDGHNPQNVTTTLSTTSTIIPTTTTPTTQATKSTSTETTITRHTTKSLETATVIVTPPPGKIQEIVEAHPPTDKNDMTSTEPISVKTTPKPAVTKVLAVTKPSKPTNSASHEITTSTKPSATSERVDVSYPRIKVDAPAAIKIKQALDIKSQNGVVDTFQIPNDKLPTQPYYAYGIQYNNANMNPGHYFPSAENGQYPQILPANPPQELNGQNFYNTYDNPYKKQIKTITIQPHTTSTPAKIQPANVHNDTLHESYSPLEQELNLDDMYWTDSADEIENACRKDKGTNLVVNILAFGDSLTRGYYNKGKNHHPYTMKLQYLLNKMDAKRCFIVENEGRDGDVAFGEMPKRMEEVYNEYKKHFDWVIILGGTNDIYNKKHAGHHSSVELTQNILSVHNIAHHYGSKTVAITIPEVLCDSSDVCQDMKQMREKLNEGIRNYANDHKTTVLLCDLADSLVRNKIDHKLIGQFFEGGLHLRPRGYELMARLIFDSLKEILDFS